MGDGEEYFPRGGKKPIVTNFKQNNNFLGSIEKSEKKKRKSKKRSEADDGYLSDEVAKEIDQSYKNCAVGISYKIVKPGLLILGRVRQAQETKVHVSLPGRMLGTVMACHISEPYNKVLEAYVNDQVENIREVPDMFRPGQYVALKVLEVEGSKLMLSMMPNHINGDSAPSLRKGLVLQAAVSSEEDHGYVMDIGLPNTRAFLPKKHANPEIELDTGMVTWVTVESVSPSPNSTIVKLSGELASLNKALVRKKPSTGLLPGSAVEFTVDKPLDNGIEGQIFSDTTAYVQRQHADNVKGKKPKLGQKVRGRVLYVMPTRNTPFLLLRDMFHETYPDMASEQKLKEGDIVDDAQVIKISGRSIQFKLREGCVGAMSMRRIQTNEELSDEDIIAKSYPIGSTHKVRILSYNLSDYNYSISDQRDVIEERYFSLRSVRVADIVDATVQKLGEGHLMLSVGRLTGYVPHTQLSDAGVFVDPKTGSSSNLLLKKFKEGKHVKARVLAIDHSRSNLFLTMKPSLLAPDLEVLQDYEQALIGKAYTGFIKLVRDYVLVSFFNNVIAYVPPQYVCKDAVDNIRDAFHVGQIVNCTILRVDVENKKMTGSLTTAPFWPEAKRVNTGKRKNTQETDEVPLKKQKSNEMSDEDEEHEEMKRKVTKEKETDSIDKKEVKKKKDKKLKVSEEEHNRTTEESDAIETDLYEEDDTLTPEDKALINLSNCETKKDFKKRAVSLTKSVEAGTSKLNIIDKKIADIKETGLTAKNKKYHTAMHTEKLILEERITKLREALEKVQEKLQELRVPLSNKNELKTKGREEKKRRREERKKLKEDSVSENENVYDFKENEIILKTEQETQDLKEDSKAKKKKKKKDRSEVRNDENEINTKIVTEVKVVDNLEPVLDVPSAKDFWSTNAEELLKNGREESTSSEDEEKDQPKKKRKKLTPAEKVAKAREEEERLRELERRAIASETQPRSSDQFERALLAHPDSSQLWIAYMAFHLQSTELEKARAVGRKALSTISFREEHEKLNVWLALINIENRFGSKESLQKTLEEALQMNDPYQVHSKLLDMYVETSKQQELCRLVELMMKRYRRNPDMYKACGAACFKLGLVDKARQVMQKAMTVLEKKEHVSVLVQFALMERDANNRERAEALFEQVLAVYPQRVDVCSVYCDALVKSGDVDRVRQVLERMTSLKLPARKMKILYKKWIEIEEKLGDEDQVERIRERAMEFLNKAKF